MSLSICYGKRDNGYLTYGTLISSWFNVSSTVTADQPDTDSFGVWHGGTPTHTVPKYYLLQGELYRSFFHPFFIVYIIGTLRLSNEPSKRYLASTSDQQGKFSDLFSFFIMDALMRCKKPASVPDLDLVRSLTSLTYDNNVPLQSQPSANIITDNARNT